MKFRMFTDAIRNRKIAINVDRVVRIEPASESAGTTYIILDQMEDDDGDRFHTTIEVAESFDVVFSRLNTIAE